MSPICTIFSIKVRMLVMMCYINSLAVDLSFIHGHHIPPQNESGPDSQRLVLKATELFENVSEAPSFTSSVPCRTLWFFHSQSRISSVKKGKSKIVSGVIV